MLWKNPYNMEILLKPIITEKMTAQSVKLNRFGFIVDRKANKIQIKKAVEKMYNVSVETVNTLRYAGKNKSRNTKTGIVNGTTNAFKKAIVTLKEGDTIDFYSNI
jgi:large subunit ribosomal protein L23